MKWIPFHFTFSDPDAVLSVTHCCAFSCTARVGAWCHVRSLVYWKYLVCKPAHISRLTYRRLFHEAAQNMNTGLFVLNWFRFVKCTNELKSIRGDSSDIRVNMKQLLHTAEHQTALDISQIFAVESTAIHSFRVNEHVAVYCCSQILRRWFNNRDK